MTAGTALQALRLQGAPRLHGFQTSPLLAMVGKSVVGASLQHKHVLARVGPDVALATTTVQATLATTEAFAQALQAHSLVNVQIGFVEKPATNVLTRLLNDAL